MSLDNGDFGVGPAVAGPGGTTYLRGADGTASNPGEPALPRYVADVDVPGKVLRGIGFRAGDYTETAGVKPFTGAPGTEFGGAQTPFASTTFHPSRMWAASYFGELSGGVTNLVITPAQHRVLQSGDATAIRRLYESLDLRLFYADDDDDEAALVAAPAIGAITAELVGSTIQVSANVTGSDVHGDDNIKSVWVTYTFGNTGCSCWVSVDLTRSGTDPALFTGSIPVGSSNPANARFIVQAANSAALVSVADNDAAYYSLATLVEADADPTSIVVSAGPSGLYGGNVTASATLTGPAGALSGRSVRFQLGASSATGVTNASGVATATLRILATAGPQEITASFAGEPGFQASTDGVAFAVGQASTTLTATNGTPARAGTSGVSATLTSGGAGVAGRTVYFVLKGTSPATTGYGLIRGVTTDQAGIAALGTSPGLPAGAYSLTAYFSGSVPVDPWVTGSTRSLSLGDPVYGPAVSNTVTVEVWAFTGFFSPVDVMPTRNTATAGSTVPVKFSLGGNRGLQIIAAGWPKWSKYTCDSGIPEDVIEETSTAGSGLTYDVASGQYKYNWKTDKAFKGSCYHFELRLIDGSLHQADFKFK